MGEGEVGERSVERSRLRDREVWSCVNALRNNCIMDYSYNYKCTANGSFTQANSYIMYCIWLIRTIYIATSLHYNVHNALD